jgi:hypothetical protein
MPASDRQPTEVRESLDTEERDELRRAAHKIAWARMNGTIDAGNPFVAADSDRLAPGDVRHEDSSSRRR